MPRRNFTSYVILAAVGLFTLFLLSSSSRKIASSAAEAINVPESVQARLPSFDLPSIPFSFQSSAHPPPIQENSTSGDTSWYSNWRWLNPYSSSVTLDEERAVLPPLAPRPPVYTYYDTTGKRDKDTQAADKALLLTWQRAWWAQGFRPVVLTQAEAMNNPLYRGLHEKGMPAVLEFEFARWLAWGHMGTGILASWHCLPMAEYEDPMLVHLRRGEYEGLTKFEGLGAGLFAGQKAHVNDAVKEALNDLKLSTHKDITEAVSQMRFRTETTTAFAHYDSQTLESKYSKVMRMTEANPIEGQSALNELMNAHLHTIWQNTFSKGIAVLKPLPAHTTKLVEPGQHLAKLLAECPASTLQSSCPPNKPRCNPCVGSKMQIQTLESFRNLTTQFSIATIPHPLTMISLNALTADFDAKHIRRNTLRDSWIRAATRDSLGDGLGAPARVVRLKEAIASEHSSNRGLWFTVEHFPADFDTPPEVPKSPTNEAHPEPEKLEPFPEHWLEELDWHFGFPVPRSTISHGESYSPIPGQGTDIKGVPADRMTSYEPRPPSYHEAQTEIDLLERSRKTVNNKDKAVKRLRTVAEAWNLADTEIWKFARAFRAQSIMERKKWEQEEAAYNGPGASRGARWW